MNWELVIKALGLGLLSACSLPLGALCSFIWRPSDRMVAVLMSFGAGALLAALTIDLVASSVEKGHTISLSVGCILGGIVFLVLNQAVNDFGGFLRKVSTTVNYLRQRESERVCEIISHLHRFDYLKDCPAEILKELASQVVLRKWEKGSTVYRAKDSTEGIYIIDEGKVQLCRPDEQMKPIHHLSTNDAFGYMALMTGTSHTTEAIAESNLEIWFIPKHALEGALRDENYRELYVGFLNSDQTKDYLCQSEGMTSQEATEWIQHVCEWVREWQVIPRRAKSQGAFAEEIKRFPVFNDLPEADKNALEDVVFSKRHEKGHTFFHQNDTSDRMYIVQQGEVALIDSHDKNRKPEIMKSRDAFGVMSFLTGAAHITTAVASEDCEVWVIRKQDFHSFLVKSPALTDAVQRYLQDEKFTAYLEQKQHLDHGSVAKWMSQAVTDLGSKKFLPSIRDMIRAPKLLHGAPLAIWLGILLDGVPESLVIGASMLHSHVSTSLIGGLFLSNFPEALSSSVGLRHQGYSKSRIFFLWTALMLITGIGAALGNLFFVGAPGMLFAFVEGVAAGAMLTMIAETMLPEAYIKGGSFIGLATLFGFLAAIFLKSFD